MSFVDPPGFVLWYANFFSIIVVAGLAMHALWPMVSLSLGWTIPSFYYIKVCLSLVLLSCVILSPHACHDTGIISTFSVCLCSSADTLPDIRYRWISKMLFDRYLGGGILSMRWRLQAFSFAGFTLFIALLVPIPNSLAPNTQTRG